MRRRKRTHFKAGGNIFRRNILKNMQLEKFKRGNFKTILKYVQKYVFRCLDLLFPNMLCTKLYRISTQVHTNNSHVVFDWTI